MTTLHEKQLFNNTGLKITNNGGNLTGDAGLVLIKEFMNQIDFDSIIQQLLHIKDRRRSPQHTSAKIFTQLIFQIIAGYKHDAAANRLQYDHLYQLLLDQSKAVSQPTISRFFARLTKTNIQEFEAVIRRLGDLNLLDRNQQELIIDVDSTHADTFGKQENAAYNAHYQTEGYHPLLAFDAVSGVLINVKQRPGNQYTSHGVREFLEPLLVHYHEYSCDPDILIRGDSGFATPEVYTLCDEQQVNFIVKLKSNHRLQQLAEKNILYGIPGIETQYYELDYRPDTWTRTYRVVLKATKSVDELLFKEYEFLVTNLVEPTVSSLFDTYHQRGVVENYIKEIKDGFFLDKTDSHSYLINTFHMLISGVAYNLIQAMKSAVLPPTETTHSVMTLRFKLLHIPARIVLHARQTWIQLSSANVFDRLFWQVLHQIQHR